MLADHTHSIEFTPLIMRKGRAPNRLPSLFGHILEELCKASEQVDFRENQIDRHLDAKGVVDFVDALADLACIGRKLLTVMLHQLRKAHGDEDPVGRCFGAVLLQQLEKLEPLRSIFELCRVAAGRIEQNAFSGEEPVAVARTANTLDCLLVAKREVESGIENRTAFSGRRVADDHVPRQLVQRRLAGRLSEMRSLQGIDRSEQLLPKLCNVPALISRRANHSIVGLAAQNLLQQPTRAIGQNPPDEERHDPGQHHRQDRDQAPFEGRQADERPDQPDQHDQNHKAQGRRQFFIAQQLQHLSFLSFQYAVLPFPKRQRALSLRAIGNRRNRPAHLDMAIVLEPPPPAPGQAGFLCLLAQREIRLHRPWVAFRYNELSITDRRQIGGDPKLMLALKGARVGYVIPQVSQFFLTLRAAITFEQDERVAT